jgi:uncharacterized membrane protein YphA (DoxX/SURF4 family)
MKINYAAVSRSLIAFLFVASGVMKVMYFSKMVGYIAYLGVPFPTVALVLVILVELPVALAYAWGGYRVCYTGGILATTGACSCGRCMAVKGVK